MYVGVACTDDHPVVAVEQQIAIETVGPCLYREEEAEQHRAVGNRCWRHRPLLGVILDVAVHPVDRCGEERPQRQCKQHPILDNDVGGQRKEIEADVLDVDWIVCAIGHLIEEPQKEIPVSDFSRGNQYSEEACTTCDNSEI